MPSRIDSPPPVVTDSHTHHKSFIGRPRTKTGFSLRSSHSRKSSNSASKVILHESHEEKQAKRLQSKADPSMAIVEVEPSAVASNTRTTLAPIRAIQHRDNFGNLIVEPDRSNPTRSRWERPLDTIRSFEAAIDGSYSRKSQLRSDSVAMKRSSYYAGSQLASDERVRVRPRSYYSPSPTPSSQFYSIDNAAVGSGYYPGRPRQSRSEFYNNHNIYSVPDIQESYDLDNSASGSGSSLDPSYSTGQSSENSSIDRSPPALQRGTNENFIVRGGYDHMIRRQTGSVQNNQIPRQMNESTQALPRLSEKQAPKAPIKLGNSGISRILSNSARPPNEKRKSWLGRQLSRISRDHDQLALK